MKLEEAVRRAVEALRPEGIEGWGLDASPDTLSQIGGHFVEVQSSSGCTSETCCHASHDPAAPWFRWVPSSGDKLIYLGTDYRESEEVDFFALRRADGKDIFLQLIRPEHYWASVRVVDPADIPEWVFAGLVGSQGEE